MYLMIDAGPASSTAKVYFSNNPEEANGHFRCNDVHWDCCQGWGCWGCADVVLGLVSVLLRVHQFYLFILQNLVHVSFAATVHKIFQPSISGDIFLVTSFCCNSTRVTKAWYLLSEVGLNVLRTKVRHPKFRTFPSSPLHKAGEV